MPKKSNTNNWVIEYINQFSKLDAKLGSHASRLIFELISALKNNNWVTCIILSATIIDVINYEKSIFIENMGGLDKNSKFASKEILWLRQKRNSIVHYQKPVEGLMNEKNLSSILTIDAKKSIIILLKILK